jgi:hypothetical protein
MKKKLGKIFFLVKTFEQTWNKIFGFSKSEDFTTKSSDKKILRLFKKNLTILEIRRLIGTYIYVFENIGVTSFF